MVQKVLPYVNGLVMAMNELLTVFGFQLHGNTWLSDVQDGISSQTTDTDDLTDSLDNSTESANKLKKALQGFDELNVISTGDSTSSTENIADTIDLTTELNSALAEYEKKWSEALAETQNKAKEFAKTMETALSPLKGLLNYLASIKQVLEPIGNLLDKINGTNGDYVKTTLQALGEGIGFLSGGLLTIAAITKLGELFGVISTGIGAIGGVLIANPILATFVASASLIGLMELMYKMHQEDIKADNYYDIAKAIEEIATSTGKISTSLALSREQAEKLSTGGELKLVYDKWSELNDNFDNLSDSDKGLLSAYANRLKELVPETTSLIDENGKAFARTREEVEKLTQAAVQYAKAQGMNSLISQTMSEQFELEYNLTKVDEQLGLAFANVKKAFETSGKNYTNEQIQAFIDEFKATNSFDAFFDTFGGIYDSETTKATEKAATAMNQYFEVFSTKTDVEESLEKANKQLELFVEYQTAITNGYTGTLKGVEEWLNGLKEVSKELDNIGNTQISISVSQKPIRETSYKNLQFATGGFPEDGLFYANHNELVGKFSNGRTAVANNEQITQGIYLAVKEALSESNMNSNVNVELECDTDNLFRLIQKKATNYSRSTGRFAFN